MTARTSYQKRRAARVKTTVKGNHNLSVRNVVNHFYQKKTLKSILIFTTESNDINAMNVENVLHGDRAYVNIEMSIKKHKT